MQEFQVLLKEESQFKLLVNFIDSNNFGRQSILFNTKDGTQIEVITRNEIYKQQILKFVDNLRQISLLAKVALDNRNNKKRINFLMRFWLFVVYLLIMKKLFCFVKF